MREALAAELNAARKMQQLEIHLRGLSALGMALFICLSVMLAFTVIYSYALN